MGYPQTIKSRKPMKQSGHMHFANENHIDVVAQPPYRNPLMTGNADKKLNPVTEYKAIVVKDGKVVETLTGVAFADQPVRERVQHHAMLHGHGKIPVYDVEHL